MCLKCETDDELADCAYEPDEHHPSQWSGNREDYPDDLPEPQSWSDTQGKPRDSNSRRYNPYQGSVTPTAGRCNGVLSNWEDRYGEPRYCMRLPSKEFGGGSDDSEFCHVHKHYEVNDALMERAREIFQHGLFSKTITHTFEKLSPWQQLSVLGWYDSYVAESDYDFDPTFEQFTIGFADFDGELPLEIAAMLDEDEQLHVDVPIPQAHENRAFALYRAAIMDIKAGLAERVILDTGDDTTVMERETVVSVTDDGAEITDMDEHHLNVPVSRLDSDRNDLLTFGGVAIDSDADVDVTVNDPSDLVLDLEDSETVDEGANPVEKAMIDDEPPIDGDGAATDDDGA